MYLFAFPCFRARLLLSPKQSLNLYLFPIFVVNNPREGIYSGQIKRDTKLRIHVMLLFKFEFQIVVNVTSTKTVYCKLQFYFYLNFKLWLIIRNRIINHREHWNWNTIFSSVWDNSPLSCYVFTKQFTKKWNLHVKIDITVDMISCLLIIVA